MNEAELDATRRALTAEFPLVAGHPDVAGVLRSPALLARLGPALAAPFVDRAVTKILAPEARGPILGALVAVELGAGLVLARKLHANHPGADTDVVTEPTWRGSEQHFVARSFDLRADDVVLVVDDWITTGSSIRAMRALVVGADATYAGAAVLVDKARPATRAALTAHCLVTFTDLVPQPSAAPRR